MSAKPLCMETGRILRDAWSLHGAHGLASRTHFNIAAASVIAKVRQCHRFKSTCGWKGRTCKKGASDAVQNRLSP
eukprot:1965941-Amphidinium_carterae.1